MTAKDVILAKKLGGGGGGTEITDGIVVKARNANGYPINIDYYGDIVCGQGLGSPNGSTGIGANLESATFHGLKRLENQAFYNARKLSVANGLFDTIEYIGEQAFQNCNSLAINVLIPHDATYGKYPFQYCGIVGLTINSPADISAAFALGCANLLYFNAPNVGKIGERALESCTGLATANIGSVGHAVTLIRSSAFSKDTQTGLTITVYTTGTYADTLLTNIRNGATAATIILKASEETTYNGASYAAGETMITSTVEATT